MRVSGGEVGCAVLMPVGAVVVERAPAGCCVLCNCVCCRCLIISLSRCSHSGIMRGCPEGTHVSAGVAVCCVGGIGFGFQGSGSGVSGLSFGVLGLGFRVPKPWVLLGLCSGLF